jgi:hypothetical protein
VNPETLNVSPLIFRLKLSVDQLNIADVFSNLAFIHSQESPDTSVLVKEEKERREDSNQFHLEIPSKERRKGILELGTKTARLKKKYETPPFHFSFSHKSSYVLLQKPLQGERSDRSSSLDFKAPASLLRLRLFEPRN